MSTLYIDYIHGEPELDLKMEINGQNITATYISHNDYGGNFNSGDISAYISAGNVGFTLNSGTFSYSSSGEIIAQESGTVGEGTITVLMTCTGAGGGCYDSTKQRYPTYNESESNIDVSKVTIEDVGGLYENSYLTNTLVLTINIEEAPSNLQFSGTYIERKMYASFNLGTGTFESFTVSPRETPDGENIATWNKDYSSWNFTDSELLTIYNSLKSSIPNSTMYLELKATTTAGSVSDVFPIEVGGTSWIKNNESWRRVIPYQANTGKPCVMYMKINGNWIRGNP